MIVTRCTSGGQSKPDGRNGLHPILRIDGIVFLSNRATLTTGREAAGKPSRHVLVERPVRQHVAGDLLGGELIPRHVRLKSSDHPVTVGPDSSIIVDVDPVGVGVASSI